MKNKITFKLIIIIIIIFFSFSCDVLTKMNKSEWEEKNLDEENEDIFFIYVAGFFFNGTNDDFFTIKFDEMGREQWQRRRNNMDNDQAFGIALDDSENVYVGGMTENTGVSTPSNYFIIKYNLRGDEIIDNYSITNWESITDIICDKNNNIYATGYYFDPNAGAIHDDFCTVKYDQGGNILWVGDYQVPNEMIDDQGYGISCYNNNLFVTGISPQSGHVFFDMCIINYDLSGNILNTTYYPDTDVYNYYARDIAIDQYGDIYIIGNVDMTGGNYNCILLKYDSSLNLIWDKIIDINTDDRGEGLAVDTAGNIYLAIHSGTGPGDFDCYTIKFDQLGYETWRTKYGVDGIDDQLWDISVDPKGNVYSVGRSNNNFLIIKYDFYGNQRWIRNFDMGGNDQARAVAVGEK